jgi:hypothetical protein
LRRQTPTFGGFGDPAQLFVASLLRFTRLALHAFALGLEQAFQRKQQ